MARINPSHLYLLVLILLAGTTVACHITSTETADPSEMTCGAAQGVISFETEDGLTLYADYLPAKTESRGAIILLHMAPPTFDRTCYPQRVIDALAEPDLSILNVDRRGSGDSDGEAEDATLGDGARLDAEAAVRFLTDSARKCPIDSSSIMLVGASNGTTPTMDYTVGRIGSSLPDPAALIWLSPGDYTETQHAVDDYRNVLEPLPILWIFPESEPWSLDFEPAAPGTWEFLEQPGDAHGTYMFDDGDLETSTVNAMVSWAEQYVAE